VRLRGATTARARRLRLLASTSSVPPVPTGQSRDVDPIPRTCASESSARIHATAALRAPPQLLP